MTIMPLRAPFIAVGPDRIDTGELLNKVHQPKDGAAVLFLGTVRNRNDGRDVVGVSYDAFVPLAERTLRDIAAELACRLSDPLGLAIAHRTGRLCVGETSVAIVTASAHREEAYFASRYVIEEIKRRLPVWKQEHYVDGDSEWLDGCCLKHAPHEHATGCKAVEPT